MVERVLSYFEMKAFKSKLKVKTGGVKTGIKL